MTNLAPGHFSELRSLLCLQTRVKILRKIASDLAANEQLIMERNMRDVSAAERKKLDPTLLQRLKLKPEKIRTLVKGIQAIADQEEPLCKVSALPWQISAKSNTSLEL